MAYGDTVMVKLKASVDVEQLAIRHAPVAAMVAFPGRIARISHAAYPGSRMPERGSLAKAMGTSSIEFRDVRGVVQRYAPLSRSSAVRPVASARQRPLPTSVTTGLASPIDTVWHPASGTAFWAQPAMATQTAAQTAARWGKLNGVIRR